MNPAAESQRRSRGMASDRLVAQRGRLPIDEALRIVRHICAELTHFHALPRTHLGVGPENILITPEGVAKLQGGATVPAADGFELAQEDREEDDRLHLAPEEALGQPVDPRADIYGLGAAFYFFLTGRPLFSRTESVAVRTQHVADTAPAVTDLVPGVPPMYARIIAKMLAKLPEERYQTVALLEADLDAAAAGQPTSADQFQAVSSCAHPAGSSQPTHAVDVEGAAATRERRGDSADRAPAADQVDLSNFEWSDRLRLGVPELDAQHKWLFQITRSFVRMIGERQAKEDTICLLLEQLMRYASIHFAAEEKFMTTICYSPYELEQHRAAHRTFEERLDAITDDLLAGKPGVAQELAAFLAGWLSLHILEVDVKYIQFFRERQTERRQNGARSLWGS